MRNYRGLTKEVWVYGYHLAVGPENNISHYILPHEKAVWTSKTFSLNKDEDFITGFIEVIPETLGQSTGLKGKNGKEIYEGDIVKNERSEIGVIVFGQGHFVSEYIPPHNWDPMEPIDALLERQEVIGNIYQNSDLLEQDNG